MLTVTFAEVSHLDIEPAGRSKFQLHQSKQTIEKKNELDWKLLTLHNGYKFHMRFIQIQSRFRSFLPP